MTLDPLRPGRLDLSSLFGNDRPVEADLGCGKGLFLAQEGAARPGVNFVGVDRLSRKVNRALRRIRERGLGNVRLFQCDVFHFVDRLLPPGSISVFHIYFPDPWPKRRHARRRFFDATFASALAAALRLNGTVWLATDHGDYFERILTLLRRESVFRRLDRDRGDFAGRTDFEEEFLERKAPVFRAGFQRAAPPAFNGPSRAAGRSRSRRPGVPGSKPPAG